MNLPKKTKDDEKADENLESDFDNSWRIGKDGTLFRKGKRIYPNQDVYIGEFVNGRRCGRGLCRSTNGDTYEGDYEKDLYHGKGVKSWAPFTNKEVHAGL